MLRKIFAFVVREKAVFLWVIDNEIRGEIKGRFFTVDLHLRLRQRGFEAVGRAFVVGAEHDCISAFHVQPQFVVVVANLRELLPDHRFHDLIVRALLGVHHLRLHAQFLMLHVERKRAILEHRPALQHDVVADLFRGADSDFDSSVGRAQVVAGLREGTCRGNGDR